MSNNYIGLLGNNIFFTGVNITVGRLHKFCFHQFYHSKFSLFWLKNSTKGSKTFDSVHPPAKHIGCPVCPHGSFPSLILLIGPCCHSPTQPQLKLGVTR